MDVKGFRPPEAAMRGAPPAAPQAVKLCIFIGLNVGGALGWWLGEFVGLWTAFGLSGLGSILGVYGGWRFAREFLV